MSSLRILHVFSRMARGGAEMRALGVMHNLDRTRYKLDFAALSGSREVLDDEIRSLGGEVHYTALGSGFAKRFTQLLREQQYDVVHSHLLHTSGYILHLAAKAGVKGRVAHLENSHDGRNATLRRRAQRMILCHMLRRNASRIVAVSEAVMNASWTPNWREDRRCEILYNGVDGSLFNTPHDPQATRAALGVPQGAPLYIHVGNMRPSKNHTRLMAIFESIARAEPTARLLLVGRGGNEIEEALRSHATKANILDRVIFAGVRHDVPQLMRASDLVLFPSLWEGLPIALLEASAAGLPILVSDLPVVSEIAPHLPALRSLPLSAHDDQWAESARTLRLAFANKQDELARSFAASGFSMSDCAAAHCRIWHEVTQ